MKGAEFSPASNGMMAGGKSGAAMSDFGWAQ